MSNDISDAKRQLDSAARGMTAGAFDLLILARQVLAETSSQMGGGTNGDFQNAEPHGRSWKPDHSAANLAAVHISEADDAVRQGVGAGVEHVQEPHAGDDIDGSHQSTMEVLDALAVRLSALPANWTLSLGSTHSDQSLPASVRELIEGLPSTIVLTSGHVEQSVVAEPAHTLALHSSSHYSSDILTSPAPPGHTQAAQTSAGDGHAVEQHSAQDVGAAQLDALNLSSSWAPHPTSASGIAGGTPGASLPTSSSSPWSPTAEATLEAGGAAPSLVLHSGTGAILSSKPVDVGAGSAAESGAVDPSGWVPLSDHSSDPPPTVAAPAAPPAGYPPDTGNQPLSEASPHPAGTAQTPEPTNGGELDAGGSVPAPDHSADQPPTVVTPAAPPSGYAPDTGNQSSSEVSPNPGGTTQAPEPTDGGAQDASESVPVSDHSSDPPPAIVAPAAPPSGYTPGTGNQPSSEASPNPAGVSQTPEPINSEALDASGTVTVLGHSTGPLLTAVEQAVAAAGQPPNETSPNLPGTTHTPEPTDRGAVDASGSVAASDHGVTEPAVIGAHADVSSGPGIGSRADHASSPVSDLASTGSSDLASDTATKAAGVDHSSNTAVQPPAEITPTPPEMARPSLLPEAGGAETSRLALDSEHALGHSAGSATPAASAADQVRSSAAISASSNELSSSDPSQPAHGTIAGQSEDARYPPPILSYPSPAPGPDAYLANATVRLIDMMRPLPPGKTQDIRDQAAAHATDEHPELTLSVHDAPKNTSSHVSPSANEHALDLHEQLQLGSLPHALDHH